MTKILAPYIIQKSENKLISEALALITGIVFMTAMARISITLPWTPVPITGQTFGVAILALLYGSKRSTLTLGSYYTLGSLGLPLFAMAQSGFSFGPTWGYVIGMIISSYVMGYIFEKIEQKKFFKIFSITMIGTGVIYAFGLFGLSFFVKTDALLIAGLYPFILGDLLKNAAASLIAHQTYQQLK